MTHSMPLVSVLIPVFNAEKYISETLDSILNQSYKNIEIILVDDGSTDNSLSIIRKYESESVKLFEQKNAGACKARNLAFAYSSGDYIQYLDADDLLSKDLIKNKIDLLKKYGKNIVVTSNLNRFYSNVDSSTRISKKINTHYKKGIDLIIAMAKYQQPSQVSSWFISRDLQIKSGLWNEKLLRNQDGEMFIRLLLNCDGIYYSHNSFSYYRYVQSSITNSSTDRKMNSLIDSYDCYKINILKKYNTKKSKEAIQRFYLSALLIHTVLDEELYKKILSRTKDLKVRPSLGGKLVLRLFSKIFGVKLSIRIINWLKRFR